jgi:hypothetical protein
MNDDVAFSISQFRDAWQLMCGACPDYLADGSGDADYIFSGLPIPTTLHATDAGRPICARMGYQTIATHTAFIEKRFLEGH